MCESIIIKLQNYKKNPIFVPESIVLVIQTSKNRYTMETSNPVFTNKVVISEQDSKTARMTINGTVAKTVFLVGLLACSSLFVWSKLVTGKVDEIQTILRFSLPLTFVLGWITYFKPEWARFTTPVYALSQGVLIGFFSSIAEKIVPGIVGQAIPLTIAILYGMLFLYVTGLVKVTHKLRTMILSAMVALMLTYAMEFILSFFGMQVPFIHQTGTLSILFSIGIIVLASFTLLLDFDAISQSQKKQIPKHMEWYYAYGLLISLIWLYIEIINLLIKSKASSKRQG